MRSCLSPKPFCQELGVRPAGGAAINVVLSRSTTGFVVSLRCVQGSDESAQSVPSTTCRGWGPDPAVGVFS
eukprot:6353273-Pyramimonas_sp.AAC.1